MPNSIRPSPFLASERARARGLIAALGERYAFASVLGTDCSGTCFEAYPNERRVAESMWTERGFVFRVIGKGRAGNAPRVVERSVDRLPDDPIALAEYIDALLAVAAPGGAFSFEPAETPLRTEWYPECALDPLELPPEAILDRLDALRVRAAAASPLIAMARTKAEWVRVAKLYLSGNRELEQSYLWGQAYVFAASRRDGKTKQAFKAVSGLKGMELLDELEDSGEPTAATAVELLDAVPMEGGEYEVVLSPDLAGILAHEAFGHGVETDMIAKGRAKAAAFMGKRVGSPLVTMYDGARSAEQNGSFDFDDEGTPGSSTLVLDRGVLVEGISDLLSARELGIRATGNGRRWSFERKAYARMTNTFFAAGGSEPEDLVSGVKYGWLLERSDSGMEDPKNWGIQLVALVGREIRDGKLTGRIASPVVCTGSVPEVLGAVSAVSRTVELKGNGYCGKGHKEKMKVSSGGPWVRTRMRLG